jgi:putative transposase
VYRYRRQPNRDDDLIKMLLELAHQRPEEGFSEAVQAAAAVEPRWNHKRVHRVYCSLKSN